MRKKETVYRGAAFLPWHKAALPLAALLLATGCHTGTLKKDKDLTLLLNDLSKRNQAIEAERKAREADEFRAFRVDASSDGPRAAFDLVDAPADTAFVRLMKESGTPFRMGDVTLPGRVTAKAAGLTVTDAARLIVKPSGADAQMRGGTLFLSYLPMPPLPPPDASAPVVTRSFTLRYISTDTAVGMLTSLFPDPKPLSFAAVPDIRSIYMTGPVDAVQRATDLLMRADRDPGAVLIDAIIVGVNSSDYEEFNSQFNNITSGRVSAGKLNVWALQESSLEMTYDKAQAVGTPLKFSAILNMLFQQQKARIIARPFITTMSGQEADMHIGENRFVVVQQVTAGAAIYSPQAIESGVEFHITPMVLGEKMIRLNIDMSNKQFVPTQDNVDLLVDNSSAMTTLTLEDGQTAIIGGLKMKSVASDNAGLPWFRRIPILNLFTAAHEEDQSGQEVFFYITPHIVKPGLDSLPTRPDAFGIDTGAMFTPLEKLQ